MHRIVLNKALNKEIKYYGLSYLGLVGAALIGGVVFLRFGMTIAIMATCVGYVISAGLAKSWHIGSLQKQIYWRCSVGFILGNKYWPKSHQRCFV